MSRGRRLAVLEGRAGALVELAPMDPETEALVVAALRKRAAGKRLTARQAEAEAAWLDAPSWQRQRQQQQVMAQLTTEELEALVARAERCRAALDAAR